MLIKTVNVADIQSALGMLLSTWPDLMDRTSLVIEHGEKPPESEMNCPWIGVYCLTHRLISRTLGAGAGMRYQKVTFWIVCKEASPNSGNECAAKLEALIQNITSALLSDPSLRGTVDFMDEIIVNYPEWGKQSGVYIQTSVIQFTVQTTVQAGG